MGKPGPKKGTPYTRIDWDQFEKLCALHCTLIEIAEFFDCSEDTIERHVKTKYKANFADVFKRKSSKGKISLRRKMFETAMSGGKGATTMMIWLSKQQLGMSDKIDQHHNVTSLAVGLSEQQAEEELQKIVKRMQERKNGIPHSR
jgi:hypothetical protein